MKSVGFGRIKKRKTQLGVDGVSITTLIASTQGKKRAWSALYTVGLASLKIGIK